MCGLESGGEVLDVEEPELPDFDTMLKPSRFMQQGAGGREASTSELAPFWASGHVPPKHVQGH